MFKHEYQGGEYFEVFSAQGKDPTSTWKLQGGSGIRKVYEKEVKSFIYTLEGTVATTKITIPKDLKHSMVLVQRYLILQLNVAKGAEFSVEIGITDIGSNKRRLNLSTSVKEVNVTPLHAKLPLSVLKKSIWVNCCMDMVNLVSETWKGQTFRTIDSLSISANCKLRRIFTMKCRPGDTTDDEVLYGIKADMQDGIAAIPRQCQIAHDIQHLTQIINMAKIRCTEIKQRGERPAQIDLDLSASGRKSQLTENFHIAFGTKIGKPPTAVAGRKSSSSALPTHRDSMRSSHALTSSAEPCQHSAHYTRPHPDRLALSQRGSRRRMSSDPGNIASEIDSQDLSVNQSRTWSGVEMQEQKHQEGGAFVKPHPPALEAGNRRRPKVRSGEKYNRTAADAHLDKGIHPFPVKNGFTAPDSGDDTVLSPRVTSLSPLVPKQAPARHAKIHNMDALKTGGGNHDESVTEVIQTLKNSSYQQEHYEDEIEESDLLASLDNFNGMDSSQEELFQFRSPPKKPAENSSAVESSSVRRTIILPGNAKPYTNYETEHDNQQIVPDPRVAEIKQPRPPDGPKRSSPRPGSGKQRRSRNHSKGSNNSNKPTPNNSGSGSDLNDLHLANNVPRLNPSTNHTASNNKSLVPPIRSDSTSPESSVELSSKPALSHRSRIAARKMLTDTSNIEGMPSPRSSEKEPRISSAGRRSDQNSLSSGSPRSDRVPLHPTVQHLQTSERNSSSMSSVSQTSTRVSRKSLKEILPTDQRLANVQLSNTSVKSYEPGRYQMVDETFDEEHMLQFLKREQECGSVEPQETQSTGYYSHHRQKHNKQHYEHEVSISEEGGNSSDESFNTTSVPVIGSHDYKDEMLDTLDRSDPRDFSVFSPPIIFPSRKNESTDFSRSDAATAGITGASGALTRSKRFGSERPSVGNTDSEEEELDLVYDPILNCYFDPHTGKYYELV